MKNEKKVFSVINLHGSEEKDNLIMNTEEE